MLIAIGLIVYAVGLLQGIIGLSYSVSAYDDTAARVSCLGYDILAGTRANSKRRWDY